MLIKPEVNRFAKIKVVGVGGAGCNALNSMISLQQIQGVDFVGVNTDAQALLTCLAPTKVQIGEQLTKGLGSGGDPEPVTETPPRASVLASRCGPLHHAAAGLQPGPDQRPAQRGNVPPSGLR